MILILLILSVFYLNGLYDKEEVPRSRFDRNASDSGEGFLNSDNLVASVVAVDMLIEDKNSSEEVLDEEVK
jgi:hypothetical protein